MNGIKFGMILIKKRRTSEWLTLFIFAMPFFLAFFLDFLHVPGVIKYSIDLAWIAVFGAIFLKRRLSFNRGITVLLSIVGIFLVYTLTVYLFNYQSIFYLLWGFRNNFRFYVAFIAFVVVFDSEDIDTCFKFIDLMFWVNAGVSFVQYFVMGLEQDFLGGIFGAERGCNAYSIIFFSLVISRSVLMFMDKEESALNCFAKCAVSLVIAALAELKVFFLLFFLIMILATLLTSFSVRKLVLFIAATVLLYITGNILTAVFGRGSNLSFERLLELITASNYATAEDLGRFTAIPTIANTILTELPERLFGMGLGNCDTSAFPICNTPFYETHSALHYTWFSSAFLFLETGYIGLILHLTFYGSVFSIAHKRLKNGVGDRLYCRIGIVFSILCVILTFYNSSLRTEVGYIAYFALALPFIQGRKEQKLITL